MREISSIQRLDELGRNEPILVLANGTIESIYLSALVARRFNNVAMLVVDFGALDRSYLAEVASVLGLALHIVDGRETLMKQRITPNALVGFRAEQGSPEHKNLCRAVLLDVALSYAKLNGYDCVLHAASHRFGTAQRMMTAAYCYGFEGHFGNPVERSPIAYAQKQFELEQLGLTLPDEKWVQAKSSFWLQEFEVPESLDDDYQFEHRSFAQFDYQAMQGNQCIRIAMDHGRFYAVDGKEGNCIELTKRMNIRGAGLGLGRYAGDDFYRDNQCMLQLSASPAAYFTDLAIEALAQQCMTAEQQAQRATLNHQWYRALDSGQWFGEGFDKLSQAILANAEALSGHVELEFLGGGLMDAKFWPLSQGEGLSYSRSA